MKEIQMKEIQRIVKFLENTDCKFAIVTPDNQTFTNGLDVVESKPRARRSPLRYAYGTIAAWYKPHIKLDAEVGSVQEIPCGQFPLEDIRHGVSSFLSRSWGKDTHITNVAKNGNIEVLRTA